MSRREIITGIITLFVVLFGLTYWLGGSKIAEQRELAEEKVNLRRQIELHKRIIEEQEKWTGRLAELQEQLPVYERRVSVNGQLMQDIKNLADRNRLDLTKSRTDRERKVGTLYEISVICDWEGEIDHLVHFLYEVNQQGLRYDIRELTIRPDAKRAGILRGDMTIECAFRRTEETEQ
jgi:cell division protein FtsB